MLKLSNQEHTTDYEQRVSELTHEVEDLSSKNRSAHRLLERKEELVKLLNEKSTSLVCDCLNDGPCMAVHCTDLLLCCS